MWPYIQVDICNGVGKLYWAKDELHTMSLNLQTVVNQRLKMVYTVMQCHTGTLDRNYLTYTQAPPPASSGVYLWLRYIAAWLGEPHSALYSTVFNLTINLSGAAGAKQPFWSALLILAIWLCLHQQVLSLVTPKPTEVIRTSALRFPDVNRSTDFLPRETRSDDKVCWLMCTNIFVLFLYLIADIWRVVLKGESKDYIHASFANVRAMNSLVANSLHWVLMLNRRPHCAVYYYRNTSTAYLVFSWCMILI